MTRRASLWAVLVAALALGGLAVAQGYQPNFIRNLLSPIITGGATVSGTLTADTVKANVVDGGTVLATGPLTVGGLASLQGLTNALQVDAGNVVLAPPAKLCLNIPCTVYGKNDGFDAWTIVGAVNETGAFSASGTITSDVYGNFKTGLENTATSANCTGNTGAVCVDDTGGFAVSDGTTHATVATITTAGRYFANGKPLLVVLNKANPQCLQYGEKATTLGTVVITFTDEGGAAFGATPSCLCGNTSNTTENTCSTTAESTTQVTLNGTTTDTYTWQCIGDCP